MSINLEVLKELKKLEEDLALMDEPNLQNHVVKHIINRNNTGDNLFPPEMDKTAYNAACHKLSSSPAGYIGEDGKSIQGFITWSGRKIKFEPISGNMCQFVVYLGDDIKGVAITYHIRSLQSILQLSNPYDSSTSRDYRYKCDFDNTHYGLNAYTPPEGLTSEEINRVKAQILKLKY